MATKAFKLKTQPASHLTIYGDQAKLSQFLNMAALELVTKPAPVPATAAVAGHVRKRFPGHAGHQVDEHARDYLKETDKPGGGPLPGSRFWMERTTPGTGTDQVPRNITATSFTYVGTWQALKTAVRANRTGAAFVLRNSSGRSTEITATT